MILYLRYEREKRGITQEELAQSLGISRGYISQLERRKETPGKFLAKEIETYFEKPIEHLLKEIVI